MKRLLLKNLKLLCEKSDNLVSASILIEGEHIKDVFYGFAPCIKSEEIDLRGFIAIPGLIDSHTHFRLKLDDNKYNSDDFISGSKACLCGGITTFIDFTNGDDDDPLKDIKKRMSDAFCSMTDYSFHIVLKKLRGAKDIETRFKKIKETGMTSVKIFTTYKTRGLMSDEETVCHILENAAKNNIVVCVHAEDDCVINYNTTKYFDFRKKIYYHNIIRDEFSENYAVLRLLKLNEKFGAKIYFVHISSHKSLVVIDRYRKKGFEVYAETCPQYIVLDDSVYKKKDAFLYTFTPPVRSYKNRMDMTSAISLFDTFATDSCGFNYKDKARFKNDITKIPMGVASSELMFSILYTYAIKRNKLSIKKLIELLSLNPANIFSLPKKGKIKKGYYADISVFDPNEIFTVKSKNLHHNSDYSIYEGIKLYGKMKFVFLRGKCAYINGILSETKGKLI